jgi:hypothetical protein
VEQLRKVHHLFIFIYFFNWQKERHFVDGMNLQLRAIAKSESVSIVVAVTGFQITFPLSLPHIVPVLFTLQF